MTTLPTIKQLNDTMLADFQAEYSIATNPFGNAFLVAITGVMSALLWLCYLYVGFVQKNIWYDTADSEAQGGTLERFGRSILGRNPFPATKSKYTATITGSVGAFIPATTVFKSDDTSENPGMLFQIDTSYTLSGTSATITIIALAGGLASRLAVGNTLTATAPLTNANSGIVVLAETVAPEDAESTSLYRQNIDTKVQTEPGSWSAADYRLVGTEVSGVKQVYAYATPGQPAEVDVYLQGIFDVPYPGPSVSPTVINDYDAALSIVLPLDVWQANLIPCPINNIDVTITMGPFPSFTTAQKSLIQSALASFINSVRPFIASCDKISERNNTIGFYNLSSTVTTVVPGSGFASITFSVNGTPASDWQADNGNIPYFNSVTYA